jgi:hypothetical protein
MVMNFYTDDPLPDNGVTMYLHSSSCHRAKYVLKTLNGDILETAHCENGG